MRISDHKVSDFYLFKEGLEAPWKVFDFIKSVLLSPYYYLYFFSKSVAWEKGWRLYGRPVIHKTSGSRIKIGKNFTARSWFSCNPVGIDHPVFLTTWSEDSEILIGDNVGISGAVICASHKITISDNVMIGANARIMDTDFHPIDPKTRRFGTQDVQTAPIVIGSNVLLGANSLVLKGVTIGDNVIIGAGSVIVKDIPPDCIAAGNPARVVKQLNDLL